MKEKEKQKQLQSVSPLIKQLHSEFKPNISIFYIRMLPLMSFIDQYRVSYS